MIYKSGQFPVDMLRYDGCYPSAEQEMYAICGRNREQATVHLTRVHPGKDAHLTDARWRSFGWRITNVEPANRID